MLRVVRVFVPESLMQGPTRSGVHVLLSLVSAVRFAGDKLCVGINSFLSYLYSFRSSFAATPRFKVHSRYWRKPTGWPCFITGRSPPPVIRMLNPSLTTTE